MLNNLQSLRAFAAYSVVMYHCFMGAMNPTDPIGQSYLDLPSGGVDLFFVISGFVMTYTTAANETPGGFAIKRMTRIVPLYWAMTCVVIGMTLIRGWLFPNVVLSPEAILSSLFFIPHVDGSGSMYPVLGVGWTLNYEMAFYLLFAISLVLPFAWRSSGLLLLITLTWLVAVITNLVEPAETASLASFYANPILFEFAAGCLIGHMIRQPSVIAFVRVTPMWPFALAGLAGFAILPAILSLDAPSVLRYGAPSVLLVFAAVGQDLHRAPARESWLTKLGDASYSAYLLHPVLLVITTQGVRAIVGDGALSSTLILAGVLISTACASLLCVRYFEKPVTLWLRNLGGRQAPAVNH